jgi:adenine-specific DNA methylase
VRNALARHDRNEIVRTFQAIERDTAPRLRHYYRARLDNGAEGTVLYYFWVKAVPCPICSQSVDLFSSFVFARHAYPKRFPDAQIVCPYCGEINTARYDVRELTCQRCHRQFDAAEGPARGSRATCAHCATTFPIADTIRQRGTPPEHRLYAKLVLLPDGRKMYAPADDFDLALYEEALRDLALRPNPFPIVPITAGYNTNQAINYGYGFWHEMFNPRQLLGLSILAERIQSIERREVQELFVCLLSGALEFNNMFASYKGEGTGAVRHMFSHHILKPERAPIEANLWGTPKSSGAFSTLFAGRLLRALEYADRPFEVRPRVSNGRIGGEKVYGLSAPLGHPIVDNYARFAVEDGSIYLSCGDSAVTDLPDASVDLVVTDPPFFDNVHYSELADFFYVWQQHMLNDGAANASASTRSYAEVQSRDAALFAAKLGTVFAECERVLRPRGLMVFTYHHSRPEGWHAILEALGGAGFAITAAFPVKSELSVASPKSQAGSPIDIDMVMVCRRRGESQCLPIAAMSNAEAEVRIAADQVQRMRNRGRVLSRNDVHVIVMAQLAKALSWSSAEGNPSGNGMTWEAIAETAIERIYASQPPEPIIDCG